MKASLHGSHHQQQEQEQQQQEQEQQHQRQRTIASNSRISKTRKPPIQHSNTNARHFNSPTINFLLGTTDRASQTEPEEIRSVVVKCNPNLPSTTSGNYRGICGKQLTTHRIELDDRVLTLVLDPTQSRSIVVETSRIDQQEGRNNTRITQGSQHLISKVTEYDNKKHLLSINNLISPVTANAISSSTTIVTDTTAPNSSLVQSVSDSTTLTSDKKLIIDGQWKMFEPAIDTSHTKNSVSSYSTSVTTLHNTTASEIDTPHPAQLQKNPESSSDVYQPILESIKDNTELWKSMQVGKKGLYCCTHCPEKYPTLIEYAQHLDSIRMIRSFRCEYDDCPWHYIGFEKRPHWRRHVKAQHGTRQSCSFPGCTKVFSRKDSLRRHYRNVHLGRLE